MWQRSSGDERPSPHDAPLPAPAAHTAVLDAYGLLEAFSGTVRAGGAGGPGALVDRGLAAYDGPGRQRAADLLARSLEVSAPVAVQGWPYREEGEGGGGAGGVGGLGASRSEL